jgi:hypothetical protein
METERDSRGPAEAEAEAIVSGLRRATAIVLLLWILLAAAQAVA